MPVSVISCYQLNLHRSSVPAVSLMKKLNATKRYIAFCQEPQVSFGRVRATPHNSTQYCTPLTELRPRASIIVSNDIPSWLIPQFTNEDTVVIGIKTTDASFSQMILCSSYMPHDSVDEPPPGKVRDIVRHCERKNIPLIICADTNSHHICWGSAESNARGMQLMDWVVSSNLIIQNRANTPTFVTRVRSEVLDLTFANNLADRKLRNWLVSDEESFSDHRLIRFSISDVAELVPINKRRIRKLNPNSFCKHLKTMQMQLTGRLRSTRING